MERLQHMLQQHVMCCKLQNVKKILNTISSQKKKHKYESIDIVHMLTMSAVSAYSARWWASC